MKLLHTADWHIGKKTHGEHVKGSLHSRLLDVKNSLEHVADTARKQDVDGIVMAGDVFETSTPTPTQNRVALDAITDLTRIAPVLLTTGNHDHPVTTGLKHALDFLREQDGVWLLDEPGVVMWNGVAVCSLPWPVPAIVEDGNALDLYETKLNRLRSMAEEKDAPSLVMGHFTVGGSLPSGSERSLEMSREQLFPASLFEGIDYTALGHIHKHQEVGPNVVYSGAPEAFTFGEDGPKGTVVVDLMPGNTTWKLVEHPVSTFATVRVSQPENVTAAVVDEIKSRPDIEGSFVRIYYTSDYPLQMGPVIAALKEAGARSLAYVSDESQTRIEEGELQIDASRPTNELLHDYFEQRGLSDKMKTQATDMYHEINL